MAEISEDLEIQLEMRERLNVPQILQDQWMAINRAARDENFSIAKVQEMILNFYSDIPEYWKDDDWNKSLQDVYTTRRTTNPERHYAGVTLSLNACEKLGIKPFIEVKLINYRKLKNAIINLLDRRQMLVRRQKIEYSTGKNLNVTLDDLVEEYDLAVEEK